MRRGLISHSKAELPDAVLDARLARLRAAMAEARLDALLVYTNNTRTAGVSWLTGFVPYWSEALLVVARERDPVLVVALTYRVKSWIERTSYVAEVIHTPRIGLEAARMIAGWKPDAAVGVADLDGLSAGIADDLREGGPRLMLRDATALFARLRAKADPAEIALAVKAASIAQDALSRRAGARRCPRRHHRRCRGAGAWPRRRGGLYRRRARSRARPSPAAHRGRSRARRKLRAAGDRRLQGHLDSPRPHVRGRRRRHARRSRRAGFAAAVAELPSERGFAGFSSWLVEGCRIAQPLAPLMGSRVAAPDPPAPGALVSVQASIEVGGQVVLLGAPALVGERGEAASLLVQPF